MSYSGDNTAEKPKMEEWGWSSSNWFTKPRMLIPDTPVQYDAPWTPQCALAASMWESFEEAKTNSGNKPMKEGNAGQVYQATTATSVDTPDAGGGAGLVYQASATPPQIAEHIGAERACRRRVECPPPWRRTRQQSGPLGLGRRGKQVEHRLRQNLFTSDPHANRQAPQRTTQLVDARSAVGRRSIWTKIWRTPS